VIDLMKMYLLHKQVDGTFTLSARITQTPLGIGWEFRNAPHSAPTQVEITGDSLLRYPIGRPDEAVRHHHGLRPPL
jgi:hypothetical protein